MSRIRRNWSTEEDTLLRNLVNNELENSRPLLWRELAKRVPGRSNKDCRKRWWNSLAGGTAKGPWSQEEDKRLIEAVWDHGTNWNKVARVVRSRYADQCSSHWSQVLDPDINYCDWTSQEDEQLLHAVLSHGTNWSTIAAAHTPQRTTLALKNRYSTLRLKHQNENSSRETSSIKPLSSPSTQVVDKRKTKKSPQEERLEGKGGAEDEGRDDGGEGVDEEGDDEGDEGDEDDEDEEEEGDLDKDEYGPSTCSIGVSKSSPGSHHLSANKAVPPEQSSEEITSEWDEYTVSLPNKIQESYRTPKTTADQWMHGTMDQTMYTSTKSQLYPGENFLSTTQDGSGLDISMPFTGYDEDAMNLDFDNFQATLDPDAEANNPIPLSDNLFANLPSFSHLNTGTLTPESLKDINSPVKGALIGTKSPEAILHQVSINLACTTEQLSHIMTWLAGTGSAVNIKIDTQ